MVCQAFPTRPQRPRSSSAHHGTVGNRPTTRARDTAVFRVYVDQILIPSLRPDLVVMDNLAPTCTLQALERSGMRIGYLPPYSPDSSPIEMTG